MTMIRCGTRGSLLALTQTQLVIDALQKKDPEIKVERLEVKTLGDKKQGTQQASQSDKKDWVHELEMALLNHRIDFAVHSGKDIPYEIEPGTALLPVLTRATPFDAFVGRKLSIDSSSRVQFIDLPKEAKVGTASLRRRAFLLNLRPDLTLIEHRGNVPTRLQKMDESPDMMGIILAGAGLERLQIQGLHYEQFSSVEMLPALNQGTLVVQFREEDQAVWKALQLLVERETYAAWLAERTVAEILQGDCKSAIGIFAECDHEFLFLSAIVLLPDGREAIKATDSALLSEARILGEKVGHRLLELGAKQIIEKSRQI
jgi:hydroxymethylbilane synthase